MQAIPQLIFNELAQRRRVILPGLGTLSTEQRPARWTPQSDVLSMPRTRVVFSPKEEEGETVTELIANWLDMPLKEVRPAYHRWLAEVKRGSEEGRIDIEGIGLLIPLPDGSYVVDIDEALDKRLNPIETTDVVLPVQQPPQKRKKPQPVKKEPQQKARKPLAGWWWWIAGGILLAGLVYGGYCLYTRGFFACDPAPAAPLVAPDTLPQVPENRTPPDTVVFIGEPEPAAAKPETAPEKPRPVPSATAGYHVITGVFSTRANAERYIRQQRFDTTKTAILPTSGGLFQVSVGRYADKAAADRAAQTFRAKYPDVWVARHR